MERVDIQGLVQRILLSIFAVALVAGIGGFYLLLRNAALTQAEKEARILLSSALAMRDWTSSALVPKLSLLPDTEFHPEAVPAHVAQVVFRNVSGKAGAYSYRELALNPTNPADRAAPFEVGLIRQFMQDAKAAELKGTIDSENGKLFYLARPVRITDAQCLTCHSTPERAPPAMLAKYGGANGFGWQLGETVGVQLLTVPVSEQLRGTLELVAILAGGLAAVFLIAYGALAYSLNTFVVRPLRRLDSAADAASRSAAADLQLPSAGVREIRRLGEAIRRLRLSVTKALSELERGKAREGGP
jgi:HAMP domain-containing protein